MSFAVYQEYKSSLIDWCNEIPVKWSVISLRWSTLIYAGGTPSKDNLDFWTDGTVPWLNSGAVNQTLINEPSAYITEDALAKSSAKWIPKGALVIALAGQGKTKGMVAQLDIDATCNQSMAAIIPKRIKPRFLFYWLSSNYQNIRNLAGGDDRDGLNLELLAGIKSPLPSSLEQTQIARFLDHEVGKIDALIAEQEKLIALLEEKRQAVISHAVTKGLNPDAPMKDSGVEWLGQVPEHWCVKRVKHFGRVIGGFAFKSADFVTDGYPVLKITNISHFELDLSDSSYLPEHYAEEYKDYLAPEGALLFAMTRPVISGGIKVSMNIGSSPLVNQRVGFIKITDFKMAKYILESTQSDSFYAQFFNNMTVTNQPNISSEGIESIYFPVPPTSEIDDILLHIEQLRMKFEFLTQDILLQVNILQERRSALISAAVTGKIDVRGWQPPAA